MPTSAMVAASLDSASNHLFPSSYAKNSERKDWYVALSSAIGSSGQYFRLSTKEVIISLMLVEDMANMSSEDLNTI